MIDVLHNWRIIDEYGQVEMLSEKFQIAYKDFVKKHKTLRFYEQATAWHGWWFTVVILGVMMLMTPVLIVEGVLSPSQMMALWLLTHKLGDKLRTLNEALLRMDRGSIALSGVVRYAQL